MVQVIENCVHFTMNYESRELQCRVSNRALLGTSFINSESVTTEDILGGFATNRDRIEKIAKEKFRRGDIWLGGVWVTSRDVAEDLSRIDRHF